MIKILLNTLALSLIFLLQSCASRNDDRRSSYSIIETYTSPSAYHGKPISRIYRNPYSIQRDYYFDHDQYYIPPQGYGIGQQYYYDPRFSHSPQRRYYKKRYKLMKHRR